MSRVNIRIERDESGSPEKYAVKTADFSRESKSPAVIGYLFLDREESTFRFEPTNELKSTFCPPEEFARHAGSYDAVLSRCETEDWNAADWSYRIYRRATQMLETVE